MSGSVCINCTSDEPGSGQVSSSCLPFDTAEFKAVAGIRASVGLLSFICCAIVFLVITLYKKYHFFVQRLILYLAIAAMLHSLSYTVGRINFKTEREIIDPYCCFAGFFEIYTAWVELMCISCITFYLFAITVFKVHTERLEWLYVFIAFCLPLLWCWIPLLQAAYGTSGPWCGIRNLEENCEVFTFGIVLRFAIEHIPEYSVFLGIFVSSVVIAVKLRREVNMWEGSRDPKTKMKKEQIKKEVKPLLCYPAVYVFLKIMLLVSEIYDLVNPLHPKLYLWLLRALTSPFAGAVIALVYALDAETRTRLKCSSLKAACMAHCRTKQVSEYNCDLSPHGDSIAIDSRFEEWKTKYHRASTLLPEIIANADV